MDTKAITTFPAVAKWQQGFVVCTLGYIIVQCLVPTLEKIFLWGEFFILLNCCLLILVPLNSNNYQRHILLLVSTWILLFPLYGLIVALFFWPRDFQLIFYFRHLSYFYYGIFFFFAFNFSHSIVYCLRKYGRHLLYLIPSLLFLFGAFKGRSLALLGLMLIGLSDQKEKRVLLYYLGLAITIGFPLLLHETGTNKFVLIFYVGFLCLCYFARFWTEYIPSITRKVITYTLVTGALILSIRFIDQFYDLTTFL